MPVNNLVYALAEPAKTTDTSWINPGKVAWDWWNDWNLKGVDFEAGINFDTYKYYIDFAAKNNIEYVVLDEGWYESKKGDIMNPIPEIRLPELIQYANSKGVDIVLWTVFNVLDEHLDEAMAKYKSMGVKGFKIDFLDRDDQEAVELAYRIAEAALKYQMVLDYHGYYKPTGMSRTFPNILNYEGVFGMEESRWTELSNDMPLYDVTFPYLRGFAGPADYTPGLMRNADRSSWYADDPRPISLGTRCRQLAAFVLYHSGIGTMADNITTYEKEAECAEFIASVPCEWDESIALDGRIGEYIIVARRRGDEWFLAGMTDWTPRNVVVDLDFLDASDWKIEIFEDSTSPQTYRKSVKEYYGEPLRVTMKSGGAFAARITK